MKFTSIIRAHSSSLISSNGRGSKMPRLLTRIATSGDRAIDSPTPPRAPRETGDPRQPQLSALRRAQVGGQGLELGRPVRTGDGGDGVPDTRLGPAIDDDPRTLAGEPLGDREANAGGGAGDERLLAGELQIHGVL